MDCVLKDIEKPMSISASTKPTKKNSIYKKTWAVSEEILKNLGLCLLALNQPKKLYLKRNMGCVLKDIDKPRSMSASNKPT